MADLNKDNHLFELWIVLGQGQASTGIFGIIFRFLYELGPDYVRAKNKRKRSLRNGKPYWGPHHDTIRDVWLRILAQTCRFFRDCVRFFRKRESSAAVQIERIRTTRTTRRKIYRKTHVKTKASLKKSYDMVSSAVIEQFNSSPFASYWLGLLKDYDRNIDDVPFAVVLDTDEWNGRSFKNLLNYDLDVPMRISGIMVQKNRFLSHLLRLFKCEFHLEHTNWQLTFHHVKGSYVILFRKRTGNSRGQYYPYDTDSEDEFAW